METIHFSLFIILCVGIHGSCSEILQRQKRNWIIDSFEIKEGYKGPFPYSLGKIDIEKDLTFFRIKGQGVNQDPKGVLKIDENTGEIFVHRTVDYEEFPVLKLMFQAYDKQKNVLDTQLGIEIKIIDENDNAPVFQQYMYSATIKESTVQGSEVITIMATDADTNKKDGVFELKIVSVTPQQHDVEFYLTQIEGLQTGTISFKGCLDHETAEKYTIIVEAKDQGEVQLSSSCTVIVTVEDGNNHLPQITGQIGTGKVKEGEEKIVISRLQVTDLDAKGTEAWRAKYQIHGDINANFRIETDPETNEGLLYVEKALDFEDGPLKNLNITVENVIPYHSCKVVKRSEKGLWQIVTKTVATSSSGVAIVSGGGGGGAYQMTVMVEDVNEAPVFVKSNKQVTIAENVVAGQYLETFIAEDPDKVSKNTFIYKIGEDPAGWVTLDQKTGKITTKTSLDRESSYVKDNIYTVTIYAIDDGKPPMTSTATLTIYVTDENDNYPSVNISTSDMCQSSETSLVNITAFDLDEDPFGGPFSFKLLGDVDGKWRIYPRYGHSVKLLKEDTVHSGQYKLSLEVSDSQHQTTVHNLTITVCECLNTVVPNCLNRRAAGSTAGGGVFGIIFLGMLLFAGILLLAFLVSCKPEKVILPPICEPDGSDQCLGDGNIEKPGTDCEVIFKPLIPEPSQTIKTKPPIVIIKEKENATGSAVNSGYDTYQMQQWRRNYLQWLQTLQSKEQYQENGFMGQEFIRGKYWSGLGSSTTGSRNSFMRKIKGFNYSEHELAVHREFLSQVLYTKLHNLQTPEEELGDYDPHVYADEEDRETKSELDAIAISETSFDAELDQRLHFKFKTLASICMPHESSAYSATTSNVMEESESTSFIQMGSQETTMNTASHFDQVISLSGDLQHIMQPYGNTERIYVSTLDSASVDDSMQTMTVWENVRIATDSTHGAQNYIS